MILLDSVLNEVESAVNDLLVQFELSFFLGQIFVRRVDFHGIEVHHFVLSVVPEKLRVQFSTLEPDFVLLLPGFIDFGIIICLHVMRFFFDLSNLSLQVF